MNKKQMSSEVFEEIEKSLEVEKKLIDLNNLTVKTSLKDITREEKIQEASKPLYLKRYE